MSYLYKRIRLKDGREGTVIQAFEDRLMVRMDDPETIVIGKTKSGTKTMNKAELVSPEEIEIVQRD